MGLSINFSANRQIYFGVILLILCAAGYQY